MAENKRIRIAVEAEKVRKREEKKEDDLKIAENQTEDQQKQKEKEVEETLKMTDRQREAIQAQKDKEEKERQRKEDSKKSEAQSAEKALIDRVIELQAQTGRNSRTKNCLYSGNRKSGQVFFYVDLP